MKKFSLILIVISLALEPFAVLAQGAAPKQRVPVKTTAAPATLPLPGGMTTGLPTTGLPAALPAVNGGLQPPVFPNYQTGVLPPTLVGQPMGFRTPTFPPPPQPYPFAYPMPPPGYQYCAPPGYGPPAFCPQQQQRNLLPLMIIPMMLMVSMMSHGGFGGGGSLGGNRYGGGFDGGGYSGGGGYNGYRGEAGSGVMESCGSVPPQVANALQESRSFIAGCPAANRGKNQKIVINDFSDVTKPPEMFIFSSEGQCLRKTAVTFGNGQVGANAKPLPCSTDRDHMTPPGFHLTAFHDCPRNSRGQYLCRYPPDMSLLMVGLEGQGSADRGILIHPAEAPGTASSWGCAGVGPFQDVKRMLGFGSLVYNYFGPTGVASSCRSSAGMHHSCKGPDGGVSIPEQATGQSDAVACFNF